MARGTGNGKGEGKGKGRGLEGGRVLYIYQGPVQHSNKHTHVHTYRPISLNSSANMASTGILKVSGTTIVDNAGKEVLLRGVRICSPLLSPLCLQC